MNKNSLLRGLSISTLVLLAACGHAIHGNEQAVEIVPTGLPPGAMTHCLIENERLAWEVVAPGTASVARSKSDLRVDCRTSSGWRGRASASSSPSPYSIAGNVAAGLGTGVVAGSTSSGVVGGSLAAANSHALGMSAASAGLGTTAAVVGAGLGVGATAGAVDLHTGGAWIYPSRIEVPMHAAGHAMHSIAEAEASQLMPLPPRPPRAAPPRPRPRPAVTAPPKPVCDCEKPESGAVK